MLSEVAHLEPHDIADRAPEMERDAIHSEGAVYEESQRHMHQEVHHHLVVDDLAERAAALSLDAVDLAVPGGFVREDERASNGSVGRVAFRRRGRIYWLPDVLVVA